MTEISDRYRNRADQFEAKLQAVPPDAWHQPSPCPDWDTQGVVKHVIESSAHFLTWVDKSPADGPSPDEDPAAAWSNLRTAVQSCLDNPEIANRVLDRPMAKQPFEDFVDQYLSFDLVVHAWDLARAAGIDDTLDLTTVQEAQERAIDFAEIGRTMGAFGDEVKVSDDADEQTKLLAAVGRKR